MDKYKPKKDKKDFEAWLLGFEAQADKPVVVAVLVENKRIEFVSCLDKKRYLDSDDVPDYDDDSPSVNLSKLKNKKGDIVVKHNRDAFIPHYIG